MTHKQRVEAICRERGFTLDVARGKPFEVMVQCAKGHHFDDGLHEFVCSAWDAERSGVLWKDMAERLDGVKVEPCSAECEFWDEEE